MHLSNKNMELKMSAYIIDILRILLNFFRIDAFLAVTSALSYDDSLKISTEVIGHIIGKIRSILCKSQGSAVIALMHVINASKDSSLKLCYGLHHIIIWVQAEILYIHYIAFLTSFVNLFD